jgi:putative ABC transport system permease protein
MRRPGTRLRKISARLFSARTMERLVDPALADLQAECEEAARRKLTLRGRWIWILGVIAFFKMVGTHGLLRITTAIADRGRQVHGQNRVLPRLRGLSLDVRIALRLLVKHIGLTVVGTVAMAFAICVGMLAFEFFTQVVRPTLPLEDGDRIVGIVMHDAAAGSDTTPSLHDFSAWRDTLDSVEDLAAFRTRELNVIVGSDSAEPVDVAEISAAAFRVTRLQPILGRPITDADEAPSAPWVVVIGHDAWRARFDADPDVIGRTLRLGNVHHTIVGVMPEGVRFPVAHSFWVPFRLNASMYEQRQSPRVRVLGRLAAGATLDGAQSELSVLGATAAAAYPGTQPHVMPRILPYVHSVFGEFSQPFTLGLTSVNLMAVSLVVLICGNVALLMFARAATRENEILVRTALGASRGRIIGQLFVEALVLAGVAAVVALTTAQFGWKLVFDVATAQAFEPGAVPFWLNSSLSPSTVLYAVLLTLAAAAIAGLLPGLKVTHGIGTRLRQAGPGGGGLRFGGMWTALIVTQVAVMSIVPLFLFIIQEESANALSWTNTGFPGEQYLSATLAMDRDRLPGASRDTFTARFAAAAQELERRLEAEPDVTGVTLADRLPLMDHSTRRIDVDEGSAAPLNEPFNYRRVSSARVALDFFDVVDAPIISGRSFHSGDLRPGAPTVIVNQSFARLVLGDSNPIGRRLRYTDAAGQDGARSAGEPWHQIVGLVADVGIPPETRNPTAARIYHPQGPGGSYPVRIAVHLRSDPLIFASRMRSIATAVNPALQLHDIVRLDQVAAADLRPYRLLFWMTAILMAVVVLLSLTGIYAIFSFIAWQRTREMGIRVALGGQPRHVALAMFRSPMTHIGLGILVGLFLAIGISGGNGVGLVLMYGSVILAISSLATLGPVRRALRIQPTEALRAE